MKYLKYYVILTRQLSPKQDKSMDEDVRKNFSCLYPEIGKRHEIFAYIYPDFFNTLIRLPLNYYILSNTVNVPTVPISDIPKFISFTFILIGNLNFDFKISTISFNLSSILPS